MLNRIHQLTEEKVDFGFETTLAAKSYVSLVRTARESGYKISLLYFWLSSPELAMSRVAKRVKKGGHNIPTEVIKRRYYRGIANLFKLYIPICDNWIIINNIAGVSEIVAQDQQMLKKR